MTCAAGKRGPRTKADIIADKKNNIPLVHNDPERKRHAGNRCVLDPIHIMMIGLVRKYRNIEEIILAPLFGVDQATISRYLVYADRILKEILPTPRKITQVLMRTGTPEAFVGLFPDDEGVPVVVFDGAHVRVLRPQKAEDRDPLVSNKKKFPSGNTMIMCSTDGLIMTISETRTGTTPDITIVV